jgi:hypothetical protein
MSKQINGTPSHPVKPRPKGSGILRAIRRAKPSPAYLQGMQEWRDRTVSEPVAESVKIRDY